MASAAMTGRFGSMRLSTASSATTAQTQIAELRNYTLTVEHDMIDVTSHDSSGWEENISGVRRFSGTADVVYLSTGGGQAAARTSMTTATPNLMNFSFKQSTSNTTKKWQGKGYITQFDVNHDTKSAVLGTLSFKGTGPLVRTA